jgi:hypothetical protein
MRTKSLLSEYQQKMAAEMAAMKTSEITPTIVTTESSRIVNQMDGGSPETMANDSAKSATPFLFFYYEIGGGAEVAKKALPNVRKGDLVLKTDGKYTIVPSPATMWFCTAHHHWAERIPSTQKLVTVRLAPQDRASGLKEEVEALVLVLTHEGLVPAAWRAKGAACRGPLQALQELVRAATPEWLAQSEDHKATGKLPMPWTRFVVEIDYRLETGRTGNEYVVTRALCRPINPDMYAKLRDFLAVSEKRLRLDEVYGDHKRIVNEIKAKMVA